MAILQQFSPLCLYTSQTNINTNAKSKHHQLFNMADEATRERRIPEPESLCHLLISHPSKRLYVRPESWTAEHLAFLNCPPPQPITTPTEDDIRNRSRQYLTVEDQILYEIDTLDCIRVKSLQDESIHRLFLLMVPTTNQVLKFSRYGMSYTSGSSKLSMLYSPHIPFLYDGRHVATVSCPLLVCARRTSRPLFAFIDNTWISRKRRKELQRQKQPLNVAYKSVEKMNQLSFDPYNASILIAIAQNARSSIPNGDIQVDRLPPF